MILTTQLYDRRNALVGVCAYVCADAEWLQDVTSSGHLSPNDDLCCRLLSHIPLLAAYTGWPTEYHLHINSQAGTQLFQTTSSNGGINGTERSNSDTASSSDGEDQQTKWRPSDDDKKYIEETVRSLVDSEDLCRLLMVAMATELERLTGSEHVGQSGSTVDTSPIYNIQSSVESEALDRDYGDSTYDVVNKHEQSENLQDFCSDQTKSETLGVHNEQLTAECLGWQSAGDGDGVRTVAIVFEDARSDSPETASSMPSPTNSLLSLSADASPQDTRSSELSSANSALICNNELERSAGTSSRVDVQLMDAIGTVENTKTTDTEQTYCKLNSPTLNCSVDRMQTADVKNAYCGSSRSLIPTMESLFVDPQQGGATKTSPANTDLLAKSQPVTELHPLSASCVVNGGVNIEDRDRNYRNVSMTESGMLGLGLGLDSLGLGVGVGTSGPLDFHDCKEDKPDDRRDHYEYDSVFDTQSTGSKNKKSLAEVGHDDAGQSTEVKGHLSVRRTGALEDDCRVTFRPRRQDPPVPVRHINSVRPAALATEASLRQFKASTSTSTSNLAQSSGHDRRPRSTPNDVKCAVRRKTVIV